MRHLLPIPSFVVVALLALPVVAADTDPGGVRQFTIPGSSHQITLNESPGEARVPDAALVAAIQGWLTRATDLPAPSEPPTFALAARADMASMWLGGEPGDRAKTAHAGRLPQIEALYDTRTATIYLPETWSGSTPAELSILVHEMVHHLQQSAELRYACTGQREEPAYQAQAEWLALFGTDLEATFQIDAFTLLMQTHCGF